MGFTITFIGFSMTGWSCSQSSQGHDQMGLEEVPQREAKDTKRLTRRNTDPDPDPVFGLDPDSALDFETYLDITKA